VVVAVVDRKETSAFPDKSNQKANSDRFEQQAVLHPAPWHGNQWASFLDGKKARPEPIRLGIRNDYPNVSGTK
jgi:hypothetical protein